MSRSPRSFQTAALVLKRRDFGEADRLLTLLTPKHGKLSAIAKGARKPASKKTGHVELFTRAEMLVSRGRDLFIVSQAEMSRPFLFMREDLTRGAYANYIAELTNRLILDDEAQTGDAFDLLESAFGWLDTPEDEPRLAVRYFEMHMLDDAGFRPQLAECVVTHQPILPQDQYFSFAAGGVVSPAGAGALSADVTPVRVPLLKLLRHIQRSDYAAVRSLSIPEDLHAEAERFMYDYISYLLESRLQSVDFIRRVRRVPR